MAVIHCYKPLGATPLEAMERLRAQSPSLQRSRMTYAGRLDPMAEGVLLVLTDSDCLRSKEYLPLTKTYRATILAGYRSDSYDALGLVTQGAAVDVDALTREFHALAGVHQLPFPPYSAFKVQGRPLHWWAQHGRLGEIEIPLKQMTVLRMSDVTTTRQDSAQVLQEIVRRIGLVQGDFRQSEIIRRWHEVLRENRRLVIASVTLEVASGTYIRSLVEDVGRKLGCSALLLQLQRTAVGPHTLAEAISLESDV